MEGLAEDLRGTGLRYLGPSNRDAAEAAAVKPEEGPRRYDIFICYAHADDDQGTIAALVEEIKARQRRLDGQPMRIFFDRKGIRYMDDWEMHIRTALRESRVMIEMFSPTYFESEYCRKEWAWFADHETERSLTGETIAPVYTHDHGS